MLLARCAKGSLLPDQDYIVLVTALPPNKNRRDRDNVQAAIKSGFDGIAQAYKVDDSRFHPFTMLGEARKGGDILLEFYTPEDMNAGSRDSVSAD
jgi:crossover junction endodeoxyribonuclease RusA